MSQKLSRWQGNRVNFKTKMWETYDLSYNIMKFFENPKITTHWIVQSNFSFFHKLKLDYPQKEAYSKQKRNMIENRFVASQAKKFNIQRWTQKPSRDSNQQLWVVCFFQNY